MTSSLSRRFGGPAIVVFRKVGNNVQLIARNVKYTAQAGHAGSARRRGRVLRQPARHRAVVSQPHPERKSVLVEANALFFADMPGAASRLEQAYRQSYAFDARNSSFRDVRSTPDFASLQRHRALRARARDRSRRRRAGRPREPPSTLPDIRSLFLGFHYTLAKLPDTPMRPRVADARIGYFGTDVWDFTTDDRRIPIVHYVNRWRLEKKDPAAALSEPKQPIVFWIDRTVPVKYRAAIRDGVLEWNKAFERIGFKDAIRVEIQPDDAKFDTSDIRHASIRWMTTARSALRRHRTLGRRSAHRRDPRRRHRHRRHELPRASRASAPRRIPRARRSRRRRTRSSTRRTATTPTEADRARGASPCRCSKRAAR